MASTWTPINSFGDFYRPCQVNLTPFTSSVQTEDILLQHFIKAYYSGVILDCGQEFCGLSKAHKHQAPNCPCPRVRVLFLCLQQLTVKWYHRKLAMNAKSSTCFAFAAISVTPKTRSIRLVVDNNLFASFFSMVCIMYIFTSQAWNVRCNGLNLPSDDGEHMETLDSIVLPDTEIGGETHFVHRWSIARIKMTCLYQIDVNTAEAIKTVYPRAWWAAGCHVWYLWLPSFVVPNGHCCLYRHLKRSLVSSVPEPVMTTNQILMILWRYWILPLTQNDAEIILFECGFPLVGHWWTSIVWGLSSLIWWLT